MKEELLELLRGGSAHVHLDAALAGLPVKLRGEKPKGAEHTPWQLLEHIRIAQWDILEFSRNPKHVSPEWPAGYWPTAAAPPSDAAWRTSVKKVREDREAFEKLLASKKVDLLKRIPHGSGQTLLREILLVADHNAYHIGQLVLVRRMLGAWKG
jgi:hypothetical protein